MAHETLDSSEVFVEAITVISRPLDTDMGVQSLTPFVLSVSAETGNYEELGVGLYVANSQSIPYTSEMDNNFSALKPQWRFLDANGAYIEETAAIDFHTEIEDENGNVRGGVGTVTFYYVDDLPSPYGEPAMLQATLQLLDYYDKDYADSEINVKSYYNSEIKIVIPFYIYPIVPSFIHFSKNGAIDLYQTQWAGNNIKAYATIHGTPRSQFTSYDDCAVDYPILFNIPYWGGPPGYINDLSYVLHPLTGAESTPNGVGLTEFEEFDTSNASYTGGWVEVNATGWVESEVAALSGTVEIKYDPDDYYTNTTSEFWVANKTANKIHKLQAIYLDPTAPDIAPIYTESPENISNNLLNVDYDVPFYDPADYDPILNADILSNINELSGQSAVYAMAMDEFDNIWYADYELDKIYKRSSDGELLFTIDLQNNPEIVPSEYQVDYTWYGPSCITIDADNYAYVGLYNSPSAIAITPEGDIDGFLVPDISIGEMFPLTGDNERMKWAPISIDVDANGEIYVYYSSAEVNGFIMYDPDTYLEIDSALDTATGIGEVEMLAQDVGGSYTACWVTRRDGIYRQYIFPYGTFYLNTLHIVDCDNPTYLTLDTNGNLWFAFDGNKVGWIPYETTTTIGTAFEFFTLDGNNLTDDVIGGLACDGTGFINVLDKYKNVIYRVNAQGFIDTPVDNKFGVKILPEENYTIYKDEDGVISKIEATADQPIASLHAFGDWTGVRWDQKFGTAVSGENLERVHLYGTSLPFEIKSLEDQYDIRRFNDSWDMKAQIKSYVIPDYQKEFVDLWDDLIGNIVGDDASEYQRFGRQIYEKIANFVLNHSDIDLANIDQVYSLFETLGREYNNYDFNYPADLKHWMNVLSITYERLKGTQYQCNRNFKVDKLVEIEECEVCDKIHSSNLGDLIVSPTMTVSDPVVIRDTYLTSDSYDVFYPPINGSFDQLSGYGFRSPFDENYEVYEYVSTVSPNSQAQGFINWADDNNKIAISGTTTSEWWEDGGYVENTFAQILYEGLGVGIDYTTELSAADSYTITIVDELVSGDTAINDTTGLSLEFLVPFRTKVCSPIQEYALPFYSDDIVALPTYPLGVVEELPELSGTNYGSYTEIIFDGESYYAPIYSIDTIVTPAVGDGPVFSGAISIPEFELTSAGYMLFEANGAQMNLPVYQAKSDSTSAVSAAEPFTIIHIGDTQLLARDAAAGSAYEASRYVAMTQWIVDNKDDLNIQMVIHTGDLVDEEYISGQWEIAVSAMDLIDDAEIPLIISPGNHDHESVGYPYSTDGFNANFPESRYLNKSWFGGQYQAGQAENVYYTIDYNGINYIFLSTNVTANNGVMAWAESVVINNPDSVITYATHNYLEDIGNSDAPNENIMVYDTNTYGGDEWYTDNPGEWKTVPLANSYVFPWDFDTLRLWEDLGTTYNGETVWYEYNHIYSYWYSQTLGLTGGAGWVISTSGDVGTENIAIDRFSPQTEDFLLVGNNGTGSWVGEVEASLWNPAIDKRNTGFDMWEKFVSQHYNIPLVFCGHNHDWTGLLTDNGLVYEDIKTQFQNDYSKLTNTDYRDSIMIITVDPATRIAETKVWSNTVGWVTGGQQNNTFRFEPITEDEL